MEFGRSKNCFLALFLLLLNSLNSGAQSNRCRAPNGSTGDCVTVPNCPHIANMLLEAPKPLSNTVKNFVRSRQCDVQSRMNKVCCSTSEAGDAAALAGTTSPTTGQIQASENIRINAKDCGISEANRVANGNRTSLYEIPWIALLEYEQTPSKTGRFLCAGSLITPLYVLTAAHCVTGTGRRLISVRLGEHDTSTERDCQRFNNRDHCAPPVEDIPVESILSHPNYNRPRFANDIALIRLSRPVVLNNQKLHINTVCLPSTDELKAMALERVIVSGWGTTEKGTSSNILLKASIPVQPNTACQNVFRQIKITDTQLCAGGERQVDTCKGDSGGPVVFTGSVAPYRNLRFVQFGIVSAGGTICGGDQNYPGLYNRVGAYMDWVLQNLRP